jgi:hypothetical protein
MIPTPSMMPISATARPPRASRSGEPGQTVLETATLRLVARTVDLNFGEGALPPQSFFDNLILELAVWPKA